MKWARAVAISVALIVVSASCGGEDPAPFDAVLIDLFGTDDTEAYLADAEREAAEFVVQCMNDAGFEFALPAEVDELEPPDPTSLDDAREMGFGIIAGLRHQIDQTDLGSDFDRDPNLDYLSTLTASEIERFVITLDGTAPEPGQRKVDRGCNGQASDAVYADWVRFSEQLPNFTALGEERDTHPDWLAARADWRDCMVARGFDYAEPDVIRTTVISRMRDTMNENYPGGQVAPIQVDGEWVLDPQVEALLDELADFERDAAVANVECTEPLAERFDAVERLVQQQFVDRNRAVIDELLAANT